MLADVDDVMVPGSGPGSASQPDHMPYGGSGFAELSPEYTPTGEEFFQMLQQVQGVSKVWWASSKSSPGNHYMQSNIFVTSELLSLIHI